MGALTRKRRNDRRSIQSSRRGERRRGPEREVSMFRSARIACSVFLICVLALPGVRAQKPKELEWSHAFDLAVRKLGEADFSKETQKFGVEAFKDDNNNLA